MDEQVYKNIIDFMLNRMSAAELDTLCREAEDSYSIISEAAMQNPDMPAASQEIAMEQLTTMALDTAVVKRYGEEKTEDEN